MIEDPFETLTAVATPEVYRVKVVGAEDGFNAALRLTVEERGERWAICRDRQYMSSHCVWEYTAMLADYPKEEQAAFSHELHDALKLAKEWALAELPGWREWQAERERRRLEREAAAASPAIGVAKVPAPVDEVTTVQVEEE